MLKKLAQMIQDKRILVLGYGKEGKSTFKTLKPLNTYQSLDIADVAPLSAPLGHIAITGENYLEELDKYDIVFKSPGIVLPKNIDNYKCKFTSQTDVFLSTYGGRTVGITGTKGKSTVTTLVYHILKQSGKDCLLAGNIGTPVFDIVDKINDDTIIVLELSCHQLEYATHSPHVAVLLNIYQDHLDHYGTFEKYAKSKKNIYRYQREEDILLCNPEQLPEQCDAEVKAIDITAAPCRLLTQDESNPLHGQHNLLNCAFANATTELFGITQEEFVQHLKTYKPLPHRLEYIGKFNEVEYYDDSISTTGETAINAVKAIPKTATLILGGMDRGIDYTELVKYLTTSELENVILMYATGKRIYQMLSKEARIKPKVTLAENLDEATRAAIKLTPKGKACILSPAAASYGDFTNFEQRGERFKELVERLS